MMLPEMRGGGPSRDDRSRHVDRRYFKVRELIFSGELRVEHVDTKKNTADILTKPLDYEAFSRHRASLFGYPAA